MNKISFICLCYNQQNSIIKLIKSIQYSDISYEIIIIDDCSFDNSVQNIKSLKDNNIKLVQLDKNKNSQSLSRNIGVSCSTGNYIMFMDGDDYYNSYELNKLYKSLSNNQSSLIALSSIHLSKNIQYQTSFTYYTDEILHSITMFCISKQYLIDNFIQWDENKYYVDGEDFYYTFKLLAYKPTIYYSNLYTANIIKNINSNTNNKYKNKNYIDYIHQMCTDTILLCLNANNMGLIKYINQYEENEIYRYLQVINENNNDMQK